ncbi:Ltp family lipoprotein [Clavibacter phaseoli]|uniref:Ltp family lipoprotein n=1 Tax=Clavibacter phaseoli TaxID=1734031 RepID=UPI000E663610|nr:Ltp family lipoprotein [Clavibacter phaseoli]RIJ54470.1 hypothetical protein DZF99_12030 [Clavibacter phaseoli]UKF30949.1 hypothetical protein FGD69_07720 [Clavibacter phaseoli]UKF36867.1 hypothetical protein FGI33_07100 [Clavibacter phaseoli]
MTAPEQPGYPSPDPHQPTPTGPYGPPTPAGTATMPPPPPPYGVRPKGLAVAALVVGIVAFLTGLAPFFGLIAGAAAVVLGILALRRAQSKGMAITGLSLGAVGAVTSLVVTLVFAAALGTAGSSTGTAGVVESSAEAEALPTPTPEATEPVAEETTAAAAPAAPAVPAESATALIKAETYANGLDMSKAGLYDQLTSEYGEQFTPEAAQYAVDNVQADWNANALAKAKTYREMAAMSPAAIRDQLTSEYGEKFTAEEADYAIAHLDD